MGHLATTGQLIILRASGISILKITWLTLKNAIIFLIFLTLIGELVAPTLTTYAENERSMPWVKIVYRIVKMVFGLEMEIIL